MAPVPFRIRLTTGILAACVCLAAGVVSANPGEDTGRVSGPHIHENLAIYLVHGAAVGAGAAILSLDEALESRKIIVHETGSVNELAVENVSRDATIFLQAGDIVKGGKQDRVLSQDLVLAPRSGRVPIAAFCVEQGRWSPRGEEAVHAFSSSKNRLGSKQLLLAALQEADQRKVWDGVATLQAKLARASGGSVAASASTSSLQLSLENERLAERVRGYETALAPILEGQDDVLGFVAAINGSIHSAETYGSPELFRKQWPKLLAATATEALAEHTEALAEQAGGAETGSLPEPDRVEGFLASAEGGTDLAVPSASPETSAARDSQQAVFFESRMEADPKSWLHRSYLAK